MRAAIKQWTEPASRTPAHKRPWQSRYGVAVLAIVVATLLRIPLSAILGTSVPFILYFPAVLFAAWYGGFAAGAVATVLGALAARVSVGAAAVAAAARAAPTMAVAARIFIAQR